MIGAPINCINYIPMDLLSDPPPSNKLLLERYRRRKKATAKLGSSLT